MSLQALRISSGVRVRLNACSTTSRTLAIYVPRLGCARGRQRGRLLGEPGLEDYGRRRGILRRELESVSTNFPSDLRLFQDWALKWRGTGATFEIVPVVPSKETSETVAPYLDPPRDAD